MTHSPAELPAQSIIILFLYNHNIVEKYFRKQENVGVKVLKGARRLNDL